MDLVAHLEFAHLALQESEVQVHLEVLGLAVLQGLVVHKGLVAHLE